MSRNNIIPYDPRLRQKAKDIERQYHLEQLGVRFIRIDDVDVKENMDSVIQFLRSRMEELIEC